MINDSEEKKPLFQVWLEAYNSRLVQVAQGSPITKTSVPGPSTEQEVPKSERPAGTNP